MVNGLDLFRGFFAAHANQYVLIGGTAATLAMEDAGLAFRATKDLDIVLHIEALDAKFGETFWRFVEAGGYEVREASDTGKPTFYRFQMPADPNYPAKLELFSRIPDGLALAPGSHLAPIPIDEAVASLSAILLDNDYYEFVIRTHSRRAPLTSQFPNSAFEIWCKRSVRPPPPSTDRPTTWTAATAPRAPLST